MKLTKLRALELCEEMWRWLAETGNEHKHTWPNWSHASASLFRDSEYEGQPVLHECFACQFYREKYSKRVAPITASCIKECILRKLWPNGCENREDSPYFLWRSTYSENERKKNAIIIADFCKSEIKKLKRRKK